MFLQIQAEVRTLLGDLRAVRVGDEEIGGQYKNCTELRRDHPCGVPKGHCAYRSTMDRDKDGCNCEQQCRSAAIGIEGKACKSFSD